MEREDFIRQWKEGKISSDDLDRKLRESPDNRESEGIERYYFAIDRVACATEANKGRSLESVYRQN
jgi:hypothetical protein